MVITISVAGMKKSGGVFCSQPESFYLSGDEFKQYGFEEWKQKLLPPEENLRKEIEGMLISFGMIYSFMHLSP